MNKPKSPFALTHAAIVANGYHVLPIMPGDKAPGERANSRWRLMMGWNKYRDTAPNTFQLRLWAGWDDGGIGVVTGTTAGPGYELAAVDIDTDDAMLVEQIESVLPPSPVRKVGAKGYTAFYRVPVGTKGRNWRRGGRGLCDFLTGNSTRQTVLPPTIHPTGVAYRWLTQQTLENTRPEDLPAMLPDMVERFTDTLDGLADVAPPKSASRDAHDETVWSHLNTLALSRLDDWVPVLNLPKLERKHDRWCAVAAWRPSSTGRPLAQRKPNLSIHRDGIKDFGTDQTYSPLDLLMAAYNWELDTAFKWLSERLGTAEEWPETPAPPAEPEPPHETPLADPVAVMESLPQSLKWHEARPEHDRLPGLLGEMSDWIMATARRPNPVLAMGAAVAVLGTLAGRRAAGPTLSGTHLYLIGLAGSGAGKDHPLKCIARLLEAANAKHYVGPGKFMSETAIIKRLKREPVFCSPMDEFGVFLGKINHKRASSHEAGMSSLMREAWGSSFSPMQTPEWGSAESETLQSPAMSIFGVSTPAEFFAALTGQDISNGFLNRFLLLSADMKIADRDPDADPFTVPDGLRKALAEFYIRINRNTDAEIARPFEGENGPVRPAVVLSWGEGARDCWETMKNEIEPLADDPATGNFWKRTVEIALRLATIRALGDYRGEIDLADMEWARDVSAASSLAMKEAASDHMAENDRVRLRNRILGFVRRKAKKVTRREIQQFIRSEVDSRTLADILAQLVESDDLKTSPPEKIQIRKQPSVPLYWA